MEGKVWIQAVKVCIRNQEKKNEEAKMRDLKCEIAVKDTASFWCRYMNERQ